jgi:broad specificity phosphatase PhoE
MKIYVMRHCERDLYNCTFESPLIDKGHLNAMDSCNIMIKNNITKIYSSPFLRTIQTGHYYSIKKNIPINIDYSLAEYIETHNKHLMYSINNYKIPLDWYKKYNIKTNNMIHNIFNNNDTINDTVNRLITFINYIKKKYTNTNENILLITHMSIVNILLALNNNSLSNFDISKSYPMGLITEINI